MMMVMSRLISWHTRERETDATIRWHIHRYMTTVTFYSLQSTVVMMMILHYFCHIVIMVMMRTTMSLITIPMIQNELL